MQKIIANRYLYPGLVVICLLLPFNLVVGQQKTEPAHLELEDSGINIFGLFSSNELIELTLKFDLTYYMESKPDEEYLDALLTYRLNENDSINKLVRLRARGNYRYRTCDFPPLRINLNKNQFGYSDLDSLENVKLVTHCKDSIIFDHYLMREYLAYKLYNIVSENSFRVRLLKIRYIDTGTSGLVLEKYAFAIEPMNILTARTSAVEIEEDKIIDYGIDPKAAVRLALFQFLIGNNDYYIPMGHNIKAIDILSDSGEMLTPLPYDFDYSGIVDTYYARTIGTDLKEKGIERIYSGPCLIESEFEDVLDEFAGYKDQFISEIRDLKYLNRRNRVDLERYIKSFYDLYRKEVLLRILLENCIETK